MKRLIVILVAVLAPTFVFAHPVAPSAVDGPAATASANP